MPLGGFGAGCIPFLTRRLQPVAHRRRAYPSIPACQFSVFEQPADSPSQAYALCTEPPVNGTQRAWQWYPASKGSSGQERTSPTLNTGTYHALYPQLVCLKVFQTQLKCEQFSPIWAENYQETSYPVQSLDGSQPITISIMLTWQNMGGLVYQCN